MVDLDRNDIDGMDIAKAPAIHIVQNGAVREYSGGYNADDLARELNGIKTDEL